MQTNHPKDYHVLAACIAGKVDIIVTDNIKDFKSKDLPSWMAAKSADDFLNQLFE